ncbi:penicillin-binding protein activator [Allosphingosinicella indica]|uniref:Amino acid/amide ABC transporter substrate-binding protein, HAAT family n=1 Tax=Allosphingosinicella indica TaxID=941907 RepID=A0A1X7H152_9SPHN|nr:penicillin-binding protein activator [Allosphingosinicella indica]SMF77106.1 amino acid/amide ABC transporter substrate-binding protein, HAAT family [Allosphingosinicella indica]
MAEQLGKRQGRRAFLTALGMAGLSLAVAGCIPRTETRPLPPTERPVETPTPTPGLPGDEARNRVAVLVPLSGENGGVGRSIANAANLALLDAGGEAIRITTYDTANGAAAAANQALAEGNRLFLGPLLADDVSAVAPIARKADVPVIAFSNDVSVAGNGVYILGYNPSQSIDRVVEHARSKGMERFAGVVPDGVYGRRAGQALMDSVQRRGGRLVGLQTYDRSPAGLKSAIGRLGEQSAYDAVLIADSGRIAMTAAPLLKAQAASAQLLGTELWKADSDLGKTTAMRGAWFASVPDALFNQFRTRYRARYNVTPYRLGSLGYDSVLLAVRVGRDWKIGRPFPEQALRSGEGFMGVDGAFRFGRDGVAQRALEVQQVGATGFTVIAPAPRGFGS